MIRDGLLAVSGRLETSVGGAPADWKNNEYVPGDEISAKSLRRTVYLPIVRDRVFDALMMFDFANPSVCSARRTPTVVAHQSLFFLNSPLVKDSCSALAGRLIADTGLTPAQRLEHAWLEILGRRPEAAEIKRAQDFLGRMASLPVQGAVKPESALPVQDLASLCQALLASNEFLYIH